MTAQRLFVVLVAVLLAALAVAWFALPEQVPMHYDISGAADRIVERERAVLEMAVVGLGVSALLGGVAAWAPRMPLTLVNVPAKDYWSRPENEPRLRALLARDAWVCADLTVGLLVAVVVVTMVEAHSADPSLGVSGLSALVLFLVLLATYLIRSRRRYRPPGDA